MKKIPQPTSPILSLKKDRRVGETKTGWALYQTPRNEVYVANNDPQAPEYIIPKHNGTIDLLNMIAEFGDTERSIIEHFHEVLMGRDAPPEDEKIDHAIDLGTEPVPESLGETITILTPATDRVWATGPDTTAFISRNGTSYIIHGDFCIVCNPNSLRMAHALLDRSKPATITPTLSPDGIPSFVITQNNLKVDLEICRQVDNEEASFERN